MANSISHAALPYPIKNARFTLLVPYLDADGDPTDPTTPDSEISKDGGAFGDCVEEVTTISGSNGCGYLTLGGAEMDCSAIALAFKVASGPKATLITLYPRVLASIGTGTLSAGSAGGGTLGTILPYDVTGCFIKTTGGTGGGGTGGVNNQARKIATYVPSTGAFTVVPNWETTPDNTTTYELYLPEGVTLGMLRTLNPTTAGRTLDVSTGGEAGVDWANVGSPTTTVGLSGTTVKTATDVETDTQDIQARLPAALGANGNIKADVRDFSGTAGTFASGRPEVNVSHFGGSAGTFSGGRPEVNATHWAGTAVGSATVRADLINIAGAAVNTSSAQLGVNVVNAGGTAWASGSITAAVLAADAITAAKLAADVSTEFVTTLVGTDFSTLASPSSFKEYVQRLDAAISSRMATFTLPTNFSSLLINGSGHISRVVLTDTVTTYTGNTVQTGDAYARLGAPAGASVSADVAGVKTDTAAIKLKTDNLPSDPADASDIAGLIGALPSAADIADAVWLTELPGLYDSPKAGYIVGVNLDEMVSTRSAHSAADVWAVGTRALTDKAGFSLSASGLDLVEIETGINCRQAISGILASALGVLSGAATATVTIKGGGVVTDRIVASVDSDGNRTAVTLTLPT